MSKSINTKFYKEFLTDIFPEYAETVRPQDLYPIPQDLKTLYLLWCWSNGKDI